MELRRFLGKIAGAYLAIGALSVSAFAVADVIPGQNHGGNWGHAPYHESSWNGAPSCGAPSSCCQQDECCNPAPVLGVAYNPEAYFICKDCCPSNGGFFDSLRFRADFLWWRPSVDCLSLGVEETLSYLPSGQLNRESREKSPDYKYDPGFRIGLASVCPCDCWDLALNWTHFHSKAHVNGKSHFTEGSINPTSDFDTIFIPEWQTFSDAIPDFAKGKWTLDLDLLDLEFGRKYYVSNCFILRPHFGLRGARVDQGFSVYAAANRSNNLPYDFPNTFFSSETKAKSDFLGVGPRVGLDLELALPCFCNFKLFGQAAGSLLYGRFHRHSREEFRGFGDGYGDYDINLDYEARVTKNRTTRAVTDLAIGLKWEKCCNWCNRSHPITLAVSWEHHGFFDFNNFIFQRGFGNEEGFDPFTNGRGCGGDLTTQGLTVSAEIGF